MKQSARKSFLTLYFSLFTVVTGVGIVVPLLPVYARDLGASGIYISLIFCSFALTRTFLLPVFGRLSDRNSRKPFILAGLLAYALVSLAFIFLSESVEWMIAIRCVQGIASAMIMPVVQAFVGDLTRQGREGMTMGRFNSSVFLGLSLGPLVGGLLSTRYSMNVAFGCMGMLALGGLLLCAAILPAKPRTTAAAECACPMPWRRLLQDRDLGALLLVRFAFALCIGTIWSFLPVLADARLHLSTAQIGFLVTIGVLVSGLVQAPMGYLADRFNRRCMVVIGGLTIALAVYAIGRSSCYWSLAGANLLFGVGGGITTAALMALAVVKGGEIRAMGSVMGLISMAHSIGMLCGALMAGMMMDFVQLCHAFSFSGLLMFGSVVVFFSSTMPVAAYRILSRKPT